MRLPPKLHEYFVTCTYVLEITDISAWPIYWDDMWVLPIYQYWPKG